MEEEEWRDLPKELCLSRYQVSSHGRVRMVDGSITYGTLTAGYLVVNTVRDDEIGKSRLSRVHRLVAYAFIPDPDNKPYVDHIGRDRTDNHYTRLRWVTSAENSLNRVTRPQPCKPVLQYDTDGNLIREWSSMTEASLETGISASNISGALNDPKQNTAGGYVWREKVEQPLEGEIWKKIRLKDCDNNLAVSNLGRIYRDGKVWYGNDTDNGYKQVPLRFNGKRVSKLVHRIVCAAFHGTAPRGMNIVNHLDSDRKNNNADNLHWCPHSENTKHAVDSGSLKAVKVKPVVQIDRRTGEIIATFSSIADASRSTGVGKPDICTMCKKKRGTAGGFVWRYYREDNTYEVDLTPVVGNHSKSVDQLDKDTGILIATFPSIKSASDRTHTPVDGISRVCKGKINTAGGYGWRYHIE
jgi:hypothetical protein